MDPNVVLKNWRAAVKDKDWDEAIALEGMLREWVRRGGFLPKGITKKERESIGLPARATKPKKTKNPCNPCNPCMRAPIPNPLRHFPKTKRGRPPVKRKWEAALYGTLGQGLIGEKTLTMAKAGAFAAARKLVGTKHRGKIIHKVILDGPK